MAHTEFNLTNFVVLEGGRSARRGQRRIATDYYEEALTGKGLKVVYAEVGNPSSFNHAGRIMRYRPAGQSGEIVYPRGGAAAAARIRGATFSPELFRNADGKTFVKDHVFNTKESREGLLTREQVQDILRSNSELGPYLLDYIPRREIEAGKRYFEKPKLIDDISDVRQDPERRAHLLTGIATAETPLAPNFLIQPVYENALPANTLLKMFDLPLIDDDQKSTFTEFQVFAPLWRPFDQPSAIQLQINPASSIGHTNGEDAPIRYLLDPHRVFNHSDMARFKEVHEKVCQTIIRHFGGQTHIYPMISYGIGENGGLKIYGIKLRSFTPGIDDGNPLALNAHDVGINLLEAMYKER